MIEAAPLVDTSVASVAGPAVIPTAPVAPRPVAHRPVAPPIPTPDLGSSVEESAQKLIDIMIEAGSTAGPAPLAPAPRSATGYNPPAAPASPVASAPALVASTSHPPLPVASARAAPPPLPPRPPPVASAPAAPPLPEPASIAPPPAPSPVLHVSTEPNQLPPPLLVTSGANEIEQKFNELLEFMTLILNKEYTSLTDIEEGDFEKFNLQNEQLTLKDKFQIILKIFQKLTDNINLIEQIDRREKMKGLKGITSPQSVILEKLRGVKLYVQKIYQVVLKEYTKPQSSLATHDRVSGPTVSLSQSEMGNRAPIFGFGGSKLTKKSKQNKPIKKTLKR